ncbi:MAG TPA: hypothetical protein PLZ55_00555 [bacterium]|nr:hypothetical protein [bacterium]HPO07128.1 hypothetical protein [bacterium]HQO33183.1 hypothetical protein [bacterium]HQP97360.1 hypothetical protein [bacterium]
MKRRWLAFVGSFCLLFLLIFGVAPLGKKVPLLGPMLENNRRSGIYVRGMFYTEVDEVLGFAREIQTGRRNATEQE